MSNKEQVILVDEHDGVIGTMEKMEAHEKGLLHRAFSVFIFNPRGEMLIHQRAIEKYHSGGLWTNACCSHPRKGETIEEAAHRRLVEEMGLDCELQEQFHFIYKASLDGGLMEHELDHVLFGIFNGYPKPNPDEVMAWKYIAMPDLQEDIRINPEKYTVWFKIAMQAINDKQLAIAV